MNILAYCETLEDRLVELLDDLCDCDERYAGMRELERAAIEAGIFTAPAPNLAEPRQWAVDLISGDPAMQSLIQNKRAFEGMPEPSAFKTLDEIVSALRPNHSLD